MTLAEQFRAEGKLEGKLEGKIEGEIKGKLESKLEIAEQLLIEGIDLILIARATKLPLEKIKELQRQSSLIMKQAQD